MERIEKSKAEAAGISKMTLRDQFCDGVRDPALSRALKVMARQHPDWSLLDLRREALRWVKISLSKLGLNMGLQCHHG